ncbi:hypothetical protein H2200_003160 [Cladophialophora chaetospira]|uniref:Uncharacterized protein n=1 Tax=Cladophialophora chaetospira TaxID=386627 RepID=A0AA39CMG8_9EURO|nr:hypothetical protein H2200_003160 [Cladophialophora chaetospira]
MRAESTKFSGFRSVLSSLSRLDLSLDLWEAEPTKSTLTEFQTYLKQAVKVCDLRIALNEAATVNETHINFTWAFLLRTQFPCLERLTLENVRTTEDELLRFLKGSRETLKSLGIDNLHMISPNEEPVTEPARQSSSIHRFLWRLRNTLNLSELKLQGSFKDDVWDISASQSRRKGLRTHLQITSAIVVLPFRWKDSRD